MFFRLFFCARASSPSSRPPSSSGAECEQSFCWPALTYKSSTLERQRRRTQSATIGSSNKRRIGEGKAAGAAAQPEHQHPVGNQLITDRESEPMRRSNRSKTRLSRQGSMDAMQGSAYSEHASRSNARGHASTTMSYTTTGTNSSSAVTSTIATTNCSSSSRRGSFALSAEHFRCSRPSGRGELTSLGPSRAADQKRVDSILYSHVRVLEYSRLCTLVYYLMCTF